MVTDVAILFAIIPLENAVVHVTIVCIKYIFRDDSMVNHPRKSTIVPKCYIIMYANIPICTQVSYFVPLKKNLNI